MWSFISHPVAIPLFREAGLYSHWTRRFISYARCHDPRKFPVFSMQFVLVIKKYRAILLSWRALGSNRSCQVAICKNLARLLLRPS